MVNNLAKNYLAWRGNLGFLSFGYSYLKYPILQNIAQLIISIILIPSLDLFLSKFWLKNLCFFFHRLLSTVSSLLYFHEPNLDLNQMSAFLFFKWSLCFYIYYPYWFTMLFSKILVECFIIHLKCYLFINTSI